MNTKDREKISNFKHLTCLNKSLEYYPVAISLCFNFPQSMCVCESVCVCFTVCERVK